MQHSEQWLALRESFASAHSYWQGAEVDSLLPQTFSPQSHPTGDLERRGQARGTISPSLPRRISTGLHPSQVLSLWQYLLKAVVATLSSLGKEDRPSTLVLGSGLCSHWDPHLLVSFLHSRCHTCQTGWGFSCKNAGGGGWLGGL